MADNTRFTIICPCCEANLTIVRERLQLDVKDLGELDEKVGGKRTLVVLNQVQVARRDLQFLGELSLGELFAAAHRPHLGPEFGL